MTATKLRTPGEIHTAQVGQVHLSAQLTVDGGVTITVWQGPDRHNAVSFGYPDKALARRRYAQIRQLAATGATARDIDAAVHGDGNNALAQVEQILADAAEAVQATAQPRRTFVASIPGARVANCHRLAGTARTTDALDTVLHAAALAGGTVTRSRDATSVQILALVRRQLMTPVYETRGRVRRLTAGRLTAAGWAKVGATT